MDANSTLYGERRRSLAEVIADRAFELHSEPLRESMTRFNHVEHRLERFLLSDGVEFINDSRATNVNSTWYALETMTAPVIWIAGGQDKGNNYFELRDLVKDKVKAIVCIGEDNRRIHGAFGDLVPKIIDAGSMAEAVQCAYNLSEPGYVVLLSPACASFDRFYNYEERGRQFKHEAKYLNSLQPAKALQNNVVQGGSLLVGSKMDVVPPENKRGAKAA